MIGVTGLLIKKCGLSEKNIMEMFSVSQSTAKAWSTGRRKGPPAVRTELAELAHRIDYVAELTCNLYFSNKKRNYDESLELELFETDAEAQKNNWPFANVHRALIGQIVTNGMSEELKFKIVSSEMRKGN